LDGRRFLALLHIDEFSRPGKRAFAHRLNLWDATQARHRLTGVSAFHKLEHIRLESFSTSL
jgi:hypothetical protein